MSQDYFSRLDDQLAARTRAGAHLPARPRRVAHAARRAAGAMTVAMALAFTLASEFPASASGQPPIAPTAAGHAASGS